MLSRGFLSGSDVELKLTHMHGIAVMHNAHIHAQWELYFCPENIMKYTGMSPTDYRKMYVVTTQNGKKINDADFDPCGEM